ncbi:hypothetical protein PLICRDRAFT_465922 [Plicaturopsis crispa FD-325 SS-3]|nr:hypothetical protein PLICRDRAFT_465922 [Plicaturopsis crispa FD-325 SS-3]
MSAQQKPFPLGDTLRDLALLRASDIDLSSLVPAKTTPPTDASVERSYEFVKEARAAIRIMDRGDVDAQGARVESVREKLEDVVKGISESS